MVLSRGIGFAHTNDSTTCNNLCTSWDYAWSKYYTDNQDGSGPCYRVGHCHCAANNHTRQSFKYDNEYNGKGTYLTPEEKAPWNYEHKNTGHSF